MQCVTEETSTAEIPISFTTQHVGHIFHIFSFMEIVPAKTRKKSGAIFVVCRKRSEIHKLQ